MSEKIIKQLESSLKEEKEFSRKVLEMRDYYGYQWRRFEIACNENGCHPGPGTMKRPKE